MKLNLIREVFTSGSTIGRLFIDNQYQCYILEDARRPDGEKIKHQTCIPLGTYKVVINQSTRFKQLMPRLLNVPMFDGILIHYGNTAGDTDGCLLVGQTKGADFIGQSRAAFAPLFEKLKKASDAGEEVTIEITEERS